MRESARGELAVWQEGIMCWQEWTGIAGAIAAVATAVIVLLGFMRGWQSPKKAQKLAKQCHNEAMQEHRRRKGPPGEEVVLLADIENQIREKKRYETGVTWGLMSREFDVPSGVASISESFETADS